MMYEKHIENIYYFKHHYIEFFDTLKPEIRIKLNWILEAIARRDRLEIKFVKRVAGTTKLQEIRLEVGSDIFRVFAYCDLFCVVLLNGFQQKSNGDLNAEQCFAENLRDEYLGDQRWADNHEKKVLGERYGYLSFRSLDKRINSRLMSFTDHLDQQVGIQGSKTRVDFEDSFERFKLATLLGALRKEAGMTLQQGALKSGTTPNFISRVESNVSNLKLSTIMRIIGDMGGCLRISVDLVD